jgi:hypothetical protein
LLSEQGCLTAFDWPASDDPAEVYKQLLSACRRVVLVGVLLEKVAAMPSRGSFNKSGQMVTPPQSSVALFRFGQNFGSWIAILSIFCARKGVPFQLMVPQSWQKGIVDKTVSKDPKARAREACLRLFDEHTCRLLQGPRGGWKDGRADAALIALKAKEIFL